MTERLSRILIILEYLFIYSFNKYLLSTYYLPGIVLSTENKAFGKTNKNCYFIELNEINKYNVFYAIRR